MFLHYLRTVYRIFLKQKLNAAVNILGLSLGLGISLVIWVFVLHQFSYDRFLDGHEQVYRIHSRAIIGQGEPLRVPTAIYPLGEEAARELPGVEQYVRMSTYYNNPEVRHGDQGINLPHILFADSTFFDVLPFPLLAGNPAEALKDPASLVLTRSSAERLFGDPLQALNQVVTIQDERFFVTAIMEDLPENTHMQLNALGNEAFLPDQMKISGTNFYTYLRLHPQADPSVVVGGLDRLAMESVRTNPLYDGVSFVLEHSLMPLTDIHLHSDLIWEMRDNGSYRTVVIFALLSVFILLVAIINFINLATARSMLRSKEIGIRKVSGANRGMLIRQIMSETAIISLVSILLALAVAEILSSIFSQSFGLYLTLGSFFSPRGLLVILSVFVLTAGLSGLYPAFYLSSFDAAKTLKGELVKGRQGQWFRRSLVVFQFVITIFVLSSLWVITRQIQYMQSRDMGFAQEEVVVIRNLSTRLAQSFPSVRAELEMLPQVSRAGGASFVFGGNNRVDLVSELGADKESGVTCDIVFVDEAFLELMDIRLLEGRFFYGGSDMDVQSAFILNERAVRGLGMDDPIGRQLDLFGVEGPLVGVVEDFHFKSLHQRIEPLAILFFRTGFPHIYLRVLPGDTRGLAAAITDVLASFDPAYVPDIQFLDESIRLEYHREHQSAGLLSAGAILAFVIALLGVYGLAAFSAERRIKETGIRIVMGATIRQLLWVFNRESVVLVALSLLIAMPLSWLAMDQWLSNFAFRITINPLWFVVSGLIVLVVSSLIISLQAWAICRAKPVNALRSE